MPKESRRKQIVLVSTPWPLFNRPSIQLGVLKAYLTTKHPGLEVRAHHFYLQLAAAIGYGVYQNISERTWLAESVYAALLHPERAAAIEALFCRKATGRPMLKDLDFKAMIAKVEAVSQEFIAAVSWERVLLAGFSLCLCQLTAVLFFIKRIKALNPDLPVVVGGSMFTGDSLPRLLRAFPEIDFAVNGEGERPLSLLVGRLTRVAGPRVLPPPGVIDRKIAAREEPVPHNQLKALSSLPIPDFTDYFALLKSLSPDNSFFPTLPAEMSRGCWWRRPAVGKTFSGCAFCNLNRQWKGYRDKKPQQVVREVDILTTRYRCLSVAFVDNLLPRTSSGEIFQKLAGLKKDLHFFCEIRADTPREWLERMKRAGVAELQIGIEALSTRLLVKLNKGITAIENLAVMKTCEELGLVNASNLILHFPGSDQEDVDETLHNLEFAQPYYPIQCVRFWLGLGSPVWSNPVNFGLRSINNHPNWATLFPPEVFTMVRFPLQSYRGDRTVQQKLWRPVQAKVKHWKRAYTELHQGSFYKPILGYYDGGEFLVIRQRRFRADTLTHRLVGSSRKIYLFCKQPRALAEIQARFPKITTDQLLDFLHMMVGKKLMFDENRRFLSLAVSAAARR
ncbi:MAG: RiPP maturation radical SAM C-methyltransferase [Desulfobacterales bacterium]